MTDLLFPLPPFCHCPPLSAMLGAEHDGKHFAAEQHPHAALLWPHMVLEKVEQYTHCQLGLVLT